MKRLGNREMLVLEDRGIFDGVKRLTFEISPIEMLELAERVGRARWGRKFRIDEDNRHAYENALLWLKGDDGMKALDPDDGSEIQGDLTKGLYVAGPTGVGKSALLEVVGVLGEVLGFFFRSGKKDILLKWRGVRSDVVVEDWLKGNQEGYKDRRVLCLQDLGSETQESLYMGNRVNVCGNVLECRGDRNDVITLVSSNVKMSGGDMLGLYGERVESRLAEMCNYLEIRGRDRRRWR